MGIDLYEEKTEKIDFTKVYKDLFYAEQWKATIVDVPKLSYITIQWEWNQLLKDSVFSDTTTFLLGIAFSIKFRLKSTGHETFQDYSMPPIQAEWTNLDKSKKQRKWKLYLLQPNTITDSIVLKSLSIAKLKEKKKILSDIEKVSKKWWMCIQTLHIWSYDNVQETNDFLRKEAEKAWYTIDWNHHEIYLNDMRRTPLKKLKTIVRYKIKKK